MQEYYAKGEGGAGGSAPAEGGEFLQTASSTSTRDANSVIYLLQEAEAEYSKASADLKAAESTQSREFEKASKDLQIEQSSLKTGVKDNDAAVTRINQVITEIDEDLENSGKELKASTDYQKQVEEDCAVKVESYEEKQAKRKADVEGLQTALRILSGQ